MEVQKETVLCVATQDLGEPKHFLITFLYAIFYLQYIFHLNVLDVDYKFWFNLIRCQTRHALSLLHVPLLAALSKLKEIILESRMKPKKPKA